MNNPNNQPEYFNHTTISEFIIGKTIGQGAFGKVKEGIHIKTGEKVNIKITL